MVETPAPDDPMLRHVPLAHEVTVPVLGVPVRFRSNSAAVLAAVHQSFGRWVTEPASGDPQADYRIILHPGTEARLDRAPITPRMPDPDRVFLHTAGSMGVVDLRRGDAVAYVTGALLDDTEHFRYSMLEGLTLVLVATRDRLPVHGAMIARGGAAVILAGPSGRGKSTVAYQALRRGWRVLADDGVYVQTSPALRIWGRPAPLLLPGDARDRFPELAEREPTRQASGRLKIPVDSGLVRQPEPVAEAVMCVLDRGPVAAIEPLPPAELAAALTRDLEPGLELYGDAPARVAEMLAARGGWRLTLSADPAEAVDLLEQLSPGAPIPAR
jgi:hypothetical protein